MQPMQTMMGFDKPPTRMNTGGGGGPGRQKRAEFTTVATFSTYEEAQRFMAERPHAHRNKRRGKFCISCSKQEDMTKKSNIKARCTHQLRCLQVKDQPNRFEVMEAGEHIEWDMRNFLHCKAGIHPALKPFVEEMRTRNNLKAVDLQSMIRDQCIPELQQRVDAFKDKRLQGIDAMVPTTTQIKSFCKKIPKSEGKQGSFKGMHPHNLKSSGLPEFNSGGLGVTLPSADVPPQFIASLPQPPSFGQPVFDPSRQQHSQYPFHPQFYWMAAMNQGFQLPNAQNFQLPKLPDGSVPSPMPGTVSNQAVGELNRDAQGNPTGQNGGSGPQVGDMVPTGNGQPGAGGMSVLPPLPQAPFSSLPMLPGVSGVGVQGIPPMGLPTASMQIPAGMMPQGQPMFGTPDQQQQAQGLNEQQQQQEDDDSEQMQQDQQQKLDEQHVQVTLPIPTSAPDSVTTVSEVSQQPFLPQPVPSPPNTNPDASDPSTTVTMQMHQAQMEDDVVNQNNMVAQLPPPSELLKMPSSTALVDPSVPSLQFHSTMNDPSPQSINPVEHFQQTDQNEM
eukprot:TRINITY_DN4663_c0_g4_i1.p1 TRINITY_DN4663_c0_g4~~TRINITY_DN4663_c0_g4_i1.p1  ORF type:complete len:557 (+),score=196.27 TRINITY_DN4663_c0_g4_i1:141-1811(+)